MFKRIVFITLILAVSSCFSIDRFQSYADSKWQELANACRSQRFHHNHCVYYGFLQAAEEEKSECWKVNTNTMCS